MLSKITLAVTAAPFLLAATPAAAPMSAASFLAKAERLEKKGPLAVFSKDLKLLKRELDTASKQYRSLIDRQKKTGQKPHSCPPEKGSMDSDELIGHVRAIPAKQRAAIPFRSAFLSLMKKKYPC
ncbi:hypothetical protein MNBD_ALPHA04-413 [hydrothermal vent metagenome]|uniref:Uncharacterized protein n=1 Tax=hydrothermal vent metagenome TaxID=652676 RepID=A0A3B0SNV8_9ZZZZ